MAFTYGFYDSYNGDRKYNSEQISELFDSVLMNGIFHSYGELFVVTSLQNGMRVQVGTGKAYFFHTYMHNDSPMVLTLSAANSTYDRYDAVVLSVYHNTEQTESQYRSASIDILKGNASSSPAKPSMINTETRRTFPLAYIKVRAGTTIIKPEDIENMVGRTPTVFSNGVLSSVSLDTKWPQWKSEWSSWFTDIKNQFSGDLKENFQTQIDECQRELEELEETLGIEYTKIKTEIITESRTWQNTSNKPVDVIVRVFGGGGGMGGYGSKTDFFGQGEARPGGGGGHMAVGSFRIAPKEKVNITIGGAGKNWNNDTPRGQPAAPGTPGGTTSFGTYISANGGSPGASSGGNGGDGGTGGGGAVDIFNDLAGNGGNASYGGGGGGSGEGEYLSIPAGSGGNGGTYGGGGGGGGSRSTGGGPGSGGRKGENGGSGGLGGFGNGVNMKAYATSGSAGSAGKNTANLSDEDFTGTGAGGKGGEATPQSEQEIPGETALVPCGGGGGGGGGGYGGRGGDGGAGGNHWRGHYAEGGGGGGGGGYGALGGNGAEPLQWKDEEFTWSGSNNRCAGGGGGGYGGAGAGGDYQDGGGGGGYGPNNYGCGGGSNGDAKPGVCIITYVEKKIEIN